MATNDPKTPTPTPNPHIMPPGGTASPNPPGTHQYQSPILPPDKTDDEPVDKGSRQLSPTVIGAIITTVGGIIIALIALIPVFFPPSTNATPQGNAIVATHTPDMAITSAPTLTPVPAVAGAFDLTIIYGGQDSLTVHIKGESHLFGLAINTPNGSETIAAGFPSLATVGYVAPSGMCLRYIRTGAEPTLPRVCNAANTIEKDVVGAEVFWYDDRTNQYQDIALQQESTIVGLCPHAGGSGRCDVASPPSP